MFEMLKKGLRAWRKERKHRYSTWVSKVEEPFIDEYLRVLPDSRDKSIKFSVVMPVYKPDMNFFRAAIRSIKQQSYDNWELCICDDNSSCQELRGFLSELQEIDSRIKVCISDVNGHISNSSNRAANLADGDFLVLMDQDDLLPVHALDVVASAIKENPQLEMVFSDEDKLDSDGKRFDPYFKNGWDRYLIWSHNFYSHLGVFKRELFEAVGGFREGYEGAQDYDLVLRCIEKTPDSRIKHIPHILYHWRVHELSTASAIDTKPYAEIATIRSLEDHLERCGIAGEVKQIGAICRQVTFSSLKSGCGIAVCFRLGDYQEADALLKANGLLSEVDCGLVRVVFIASSKKLSIGKVIDCRVVIDRVVDRDDEIKINQIAVEAIESSECANILFLGDLVSTSEGFLSEMLGLIAMPGVSIVGGSIENLRNELLHGGYRSRDDKLYMVNHKVKKSGYRSSAWSLQKVFAVSYDFMLVENSVLLGQGWLGLLLGCCKDTNAEFFVLENGKNNRVLWTPLARAKIDVRAGFGEPLGLSKMQLSRSDASRHVFVSPHVCVNKTFLRMNLGGSKMFFKHELDAARS